MSGRMARVLGAATAVAMVALVLPASGRSAFPGDNGPIVFVSDRNANDEI